MLGVGSPSLPQQVESSALGTQINSPGLDGVLLLLLSLPHLFPAFLRGVQNSPASLGGALPPPCILGGGGQRGDTGEQGPHWGWSEEPQRGGEL